MKFKNINLILYIALILTACAPAVTVVSPTETVVPFPTVSPIHPTAILISTSVPETAVQTSELTAALSAEGPWLVYRHNALSLGYGDVGPTPEEFVLMNQDGSGHTLITLPECDDRVNAFLMEGENSDNYIAEIGGSTYIFRPSQTTGLLMYRQLWYSDCQTFFRGDKKDGLLASFYQASREVSPELILYELPSGKIRERFPLVRCSKDTNVCDEYRSNWPQMMWQQPQWSPNGRYLAFVAILDAKSSDLFVYDTQNRNLRRLTNGPDWVGPIEWSPDGTQIIMQELLNDFEFFFDPHAKPPSSVWSVSVNTNEIKMLYSTGDAYTIQNILFWLDDKRFFAYQGFLVNADQAVDLRLVDMEAGTNRILFDGDFVSIDYDPIHETFALYELESSKYPQGIYLVSVKNETIHYLEGPPYNLNLDEWDSATGLFLTNNVCENDPNSLQAFNYQGTFKCVPNATPTSASLETANYPAPNGQWSVSAKDELWLETDGGPAMNVSQETASDVIWCPDSSCFFFSVLQQNHQWTLYRVSLPDLTVKMVDEGIGSRGSYQWLGGEK
jgi:WD40 repeat protein